MQKVNIILVDDIDGTEDAAETVTFGLDGDHYEIDLTEANAIALRTAFAPYVSNARTVQKRRGRKPAALAEAQTKAAKKTAGTKRGGTRKRTASMEEVEAAKVG